MKKRVEKIFKNTDQNVDAILIKNSSEKFTDSNFFYVTGLNKGLFENSLVILYPDGSKNLLVPYLEEESAKKAKDSDVFVYTDLESYNENLKKFLENVKNLGINYTAISYKDFRDLKQLNPEINLLNVEENLNKTRRVKDKKEISILKDASRIVDTVVEKIPDLISEGIHEFELAAEIDYLMGKNGADKPAFETISSSGFFTAEPHYTHGEKKIVKGDFVLCDFGASFMKYNSDTTRTFVFGCADDRQKKMYETVKNAQQIGLELIKPGVKASEVHKAVYDFIQKSSFKDCFIHSTGHSLGLDVHDPGLSINSECDIILEENMVFTVEPGVYLPGFGGVRIEDDIRVISDGFEFLTQSDKELLII